MALAFFKRVSFFSVSSLVGVGSLNSSHFSFTVSTALQEKSMLHVFAVTIDRCFSGLSRCVQKDETPASDLILLEFTWTWSPLFRKYNVDMLRSSSGSGRLRYECDMALNTFFVLK